MCNTFNVKNHSFSAYAKKLRLTSIIYLFDIDKHMCISGDEKSQFFGKFCKYTKWTFLSKISLDILLLR